MLMMRVPISEFYFAEGYSQRQIKSKYLFDKISMEVSVKYQGKKKKLKASSLKSYEVMRADIVKCMPKIPTDFEIAYMDEDGDWIDIEGDYQLQALVEGKTKRNVTLYLRNQGEEHQNQQDVSIREPEHRFNYVQNSNNREKITILDGDLQENQYGHIGEISPGLTCISSIKAEQEHSDIEPTTILESNNEKIQKTSGDQPNSVLGGKKVQTLPAKSKIKQKEEPSSSAFKKKAGNRSSSLKKSSIISSSVVPSGHKELSYIHANIMCDVCSLKEIEGSRWKCRSCSEFNSCDPCYKSSRHITDKNHDKKHKFVQIPDGSFWKKVNFSHIVRKAFDPNYAVNSSTDEIGEWISQEDIELNNPNYVREVWKASEPLANQIVKGFDDWQTRYDRHIKK